MKRLIALFALLFTLSLAAAAFAITVDGAEEYQKHIKQLAEDEQYYRNNANFADKKLDDTSWWNLYGKVKWGLEKYSNNNQADAAQDEKKIIQDRYNDELLAEKNRRENETKNYRDDQADRLKDLRYQNEKIKEFREDEKHYTENEKFADKKLQETDWWNLPGKLHWGLEKWSNGNKAEDAGDSVKEWQKERDGNLTELKEDSEEFAFRKRLDALKDQAIKGGQKEKDYYDMMEKAYEYYKNKEKYESTSTWSPLFGVFPKIINKMKLDHSLDEAREAQKKVYPNLYKETKPAETTKLQQLNDKLSKQGIKNN